MDEQREARSVNWGELVGGVLAGWLLCWAVYAFGGALGYAMIGDSRYAAAWFWAALAVTPLVLLGVVLVRRRRGELVAGFLLGLTVGSILGAGVCTTFNLVNMA